VTRVTKSENVSAEDALDSFVHRLGVFTRDLSEREQKILIAILLDSMDPLDKIAHSITEESELLSGKEEEFLRSLENRASNKQ
jgi:hypothetical protein